VKFGAGAEEKFTSGAAKSYDALVFYDMNQDCSAYADSLLDLFAAGKGAVFLHHALGSCPDVEEYSWLVGGRARWKKAPGANLTISKYKHDESYRAHPVTTHPIAASMSDFDVHDETFWNYFVNTDNDAFLTTTYPGSAKTLGWTHQYKNSKIAYLQLGHDKVAYANPNYRRLVERMILWVTGKLPAQ